MRNPCRDAPKYGRKTTVVFFAGWMSLFAMAVGAGECPKPAPVPPTLEIEILDPSADPLGNPAVLTELADDPRFGPIERIQTPPCVIVHRYYYTGDRSFQGPMFPGGPTVIVVHHPKTGEKQYIETQLLPGAPRVTYRRRSIEYDYGPQAIVLSFGICGKPKVCYRNGTPIARKVGNASKACLRHAGQLVERTNLPAGAAAACRGAKNITNTTADRVGEVGRIAVLPVANAARMLPMASWFESDPAERAEVIRNNKVRAAETKNLAQSASIPTLR